MEDLLLRDESLSGSSVRVKGKIVCWKHGFGFIKPDSEEAPLFFHKTSLNWSPKNTPILLNQVSFEIGVSELEKHKGRPVASKVHNEAILKLNQYKRIIGRLEEWDGESGFIKTSMQVERIWIGLGQNLFPSDYLKTGDLVVFSQVKNKLNDNRSAELAYLINQENDIVFLQEQYNDSHEEGILVYIDRLIVKLSKTVSLNDLFNLELDTIGYVDSYSIFLKLLTLTRKYKAKGFVPKWEFLKKNCSEVYLIQAWELGLITANNLLVISEYFEKSDSGKKKLLLNLLKGEEKVFLLKNYTEKLEKLGYLRSPNNALRTLLDIVYRTADPFDTYLADLYHFIKKILLRNLTDIELEELWIAEYLDEIPDSIIDSLINQFKVEITSGILKKGSFYIRNKVKEAYLQYFTNAVESGEDLEPMMFASRLLYYRSEFEIEFQSLISHLESNLDDRNRFLLWLFDVPLLIKATSYFKENYSSLNAYQQIRFFIHEGIPSSNDEIKALRLKVVPDFESVKEFITGNPWSQVFQPTEIEPEIEYGFYFLLDIKKYLKRFPIETEISTKSPIITNLADFIFNLIPAFSVQHIRLWLYNYVDIEKYSYVGFRQGFELLTRKEKVNFKHRGTNMAQIAKVIIPELNEVEPCSNIIESDPFYKVYECFIRNIYFLDGKLKLRKENSQYTEILLFPTVTVGFNRVSELTDIGKMVIFIKVNSNNEIELISGLDEIIYRIQTEEIQRALLSNNELGTAEDPDKVSYVEDWSLRKSILAYLNSEQSSNCKIREVFEMHARTDGYSNISSLNSLVQLFSIKTSDGFAIIWESIDLKADRATYVFKTSIDHLSVQIEKIAYAVASQHRLRSVLISSEPDQKTILYRDNLGFINTVRKERGDSESFVNWKNKLLNTFKKVIPEIPSDDELKRIKSWEPTVSGAIKTNRLKKVISAKDVKVSNIDFNKLDNDHPEVLSQVSLIKWLDRRVLTALQSFNNDFFNL